ncbi:MAG: hypothetical protein K2X00_20080 [Nitrospiraceae bacterium]|jgi:hypothetical protein|nr:hypothetical protein [Nitrospiraceae bacterium]OQW68288.1 MAG: hypothetical protein BVN29_00115 [Nitrospira sp. ST-bin5]
MTDTKNHSASGAASSLQGRQFAPHSFAELAEAIELAFDYRGDVTVTLRSGQHVTGYLFNRTVQGQASTFEVFPEGDSGVQVIRYADVVSVAFSGEDTASGNSWESWVAKKDSERKAEADKIAQDARARGHL